MHRPCGARAVCVNLPHVRCGILGPRNTLLGKWYVSFLDGDEQVTGHTDRRFVSRYLFNENQTLKRRKILTNKSEQNKTKRTSSGNKTQKLTRDGVDYWSIPIDITCSMHIHNEVIYSISETVFPVCGNSNEVSTLLQHSEVSENLTHTHQISVCVRSKSKHENQMFFVF